MKNKFYLLLSIFIHLNLLCYAENKGLFFTARTDYGRVFQTNDFVRGINKKNQTVNEFAAFSLGFGKQSAGKRDWEQLYNFPSYGLALYALLPEGGDELGRPLALYGFLNGAFRRWEKSSFVYKIEGGFAYGWNPYDFDKNPFNIVIGSKGTVYIGLRASYNYWLTKHLELSAGAGFTHFSNGSYKKPNKGLNLVSPHIALNYYLQSKPEFIRKSYIPPYPKNHEIFVTAGAGIKAFNQEIWYLRGTPYEYDNFQYKVFTASLAYMRQYSYMSKTGGGISVIYDEWGGSRFDTSGVSVIYDERGGIHLDMSGGKPFTVLGRQRDRFAVNLFAAHEFCIHRVSILAQVGYYLWQGMPEEKKLSLNEKVGIKYHFKSNLFAGISLLAHNFSVADYIEWNVGYRFKWQ